MSATNTTGGAAIRSSDEPIYSSNSPVQLWTTNATSSNVLWQLVREDAPPVEDVRQCLRDGGDLHFVPPGMGSWSLLEAIVLSGKTDLFTVCLEAAPYPLQFSVGSTQHDSVLHILASSNRISTSEAVRMMGVLCQRVERHPLDVVQWEKKGSNGEAFLPLAARHQRLSALWPLVKEMPFFADKVERFTLPLAWSWDLEALSEEDREMFVLENVADAAESTGRLWKLLRDKKSPLSDVEACLTSGADVLFIPADYHCSILELTLLLRPEVFSICVDSPYPLNFRRTDERGNTLLHRLASPSILTTPKAVEVMAGISQRMNSHPGDTIDWTQRDEKGRDFLSLAVQHQRLSALWPYVKKHFPTTPISLPLAYTSDLEKLTPADRCLFDVRREL